MATTAAPNGSRIDPEIRKFAVQTGATGIRHDGTSVGVRYDDIESNFRPSDIPEGYDPVISPEPWMTVDFYNNPTK